MTVGIYGYYDNYKDKVIYIGQAQNIEKRHKEHYHKSQYDRQHINRVLQNNLDRYSLYVLKKCCIDDLDYWEVTLIALFNPLFNFNNGGKNNRGYRHTDKARKKMSESHKGKKISDKVKQKMSKNACRFFLGKEFSDEHKNKISESLKGRKLTKKHKKNISNAMNGKKNPFYGKKHSDITKNKISNANKKNDLNTQYKEIRKGVNHGKDVYVYRYNGKKIMQSISMKKLIIRIKNKKLPLTLMEEY